MKLSRTISTSLLLLIAILWSCYEPYPPPASGANASLLVVDAFVNSENGSATIRLSRTVPLASADTFENVDHASVKIISESGSEAVVEFQSEGRYAATGLSIDPDNRYKLTISTGDYTYESEYVAALQTPPIDTIGWEIDGNHLNVLVNTHDPLGVSRYYRWKFIETWQYHSHYHTPYVVRNDSAWARLPSEDISTCWRTENSQNISVYSTRYLADDIVSNFTIQQIPLNSIKLSSRYSIFVQQQTLSQDAYRYWQHVKETSESLGTLFDPLPAAVKGNIMCINNPSERVVGFFSVGSVTEKRVYIDNSEIKDHVTYQYPPCSLDKIICDTTKGTWYDANPRLHFGSPDEVVGEITNQGGEVIGYIITSTICTDCRKSGGGSTNKPEFWKD